MNLKEGEYFTTIEGFTGDNGLEAQADSTGSRLIRQLTLRTNMHNVKTFGAQKLSLKKQPVNNGDDLARFQPFERTVPEGSEIRSFFGFSADGGLRGIGVRYTTDNLHPSPAAQASTYVL
jgi:hypothetical protein